MITQLLLSALTLAALFLPFSSARAQELAGDSDAISYTIREGDTLIGLGRRYFARATSYREVERVNGLANANQLRAGSRITIPLDILRFSPQSAIVVAMSGTATLTRADRSQPLALRARVLEGDIVETGPDGYLTFQLNNGSRSALPSNARVRVARLRTYLLTGGTDIEFMVERGRTETTVVPLRDGRSRFRIRTPVAVSAVRGTVFRIGYEGPDASLTEVVEGNVVVNIAGRSASTALPSGFGAAARASGDVLTEALLPPPSFAGVGEVQAQRTVIFALSPAENAAGYHVEIAKDAAFIDIVSAARSSVPLVDVGSLPDGDYWVRAMAIAQSGLVGLPQAQEFRRTLQSLRTVAHDEHHDAIKFEWDIGVRTLFRFQLFDNDVSQIPLIDEPGLSENEIMVRDLPNGNYAWRVGRLNNHLGRFVEVWTPFEPFVVDR